MMHDEYRGSGSSGELPANQVAEIRHSAPKKALDAFTILKSTTGLASKRIVAGPQGTPTVIDFNAGALFSIFEAPVSNIIGLSAMLKVVEAQRDCLVIRGAPRVDLDVSRTQRRLKTNFQSPPSGRRWIFIDFDKVPLPPGLSLQQDIGGVCEHLVRLLPVEFHATSYHWQLSSSAGITDPSVVSLHLWFWLDRPIPDAPLKAWAEHWNAEAGMKLIDPALFNDVQAHYTAAPIFDGLSDPFSVRSGLMRKAVDEVALKLPPPQKKSPVRASGNPLQLSGGFEAFLAQIGDHEGGLGFHNPIIRAVASFVATHGRDGTDVEALYEVVRAKVLAADHSKHDMAYVEQMASREHVIPAIKQALPKFAKPNALRRKSRQIPGVRPHFTSKPVATADATAILQRAIDGFFGQKP
jgi:hypothetical protein